MFTINIRKQPNDPQRDMTEVREPVWTYLRQHCNSFDTLSGDAVFSDRRAINQFVHLVTM